MTRFHSNPLARRVRRIAFLLLLSYLLPFAQMAHAASSDAETPLPACCRTHGKHKCSVRVPLQLQHADGKHAASSSAQIIEKCPCLPWGPSVSDSVHSGPPPGANVRFVHRSESLCLAAEASQRAPRTSPAHHKRGPPARSFFA